MPKCEMFINYAPNEECRIAILSDGLLEELYQERASSESHVGNIYKGKIVHIERSIQAAFIDFGLDRNGFLHISDLHPMYFGEDSKEDLERIGKKTPHHDRPPIQNCLHRGQDVLVQVLKEGIGTKGPTLTTYLSIPGRFLVLLPFMERLGVSRKVEDDEARHKIREILDELNPPKDFGFIIRTAGIGRTKADLKRDLGYLQRLWKTIEKRMQHTDPVGEVYTELDLMIRTIRDVFTSDIQRIIVDDESAAKRAQNFLTIANPRSGSTVMVYRGPIPLFHQHNIEQQIENIHNRVVPMKSGGSLVIDSTEALVAIDVNSGKNREGRDAETTAYKINAEAADEACRQLRLRDLGGVIVIDLIDMRASKHRREIEQRFKNNLKKDRARTLVSPISQFGILEMTRQRMRPSLKKSVYMDCPACQGAGLVKSPESVVLDVMRRLALILHHEKVARVELTVSPDVAYPLLNFKRNQVAKLEQQYNKTVTVRVGGSSIDYIQFNLWDASGGTLDILSITPAGPTDPHNLEALLENPAATNTPRPQTTAPETAQEDNTPTATAEPTTTKPRRRRRRRNGHAKNNDDTATEKTPRADTVKDPKTTGASTASAEATNESTKDGNTEPSTSRPRRRRRRGGRGRTRSTGNEQTATDGKTDPPQSAAKNKPATRSKEANKPTDSKPAVKPTNPTTT